MRYKSLLAAVAIFMACHPSFAQNDQAPSTAEPARSAHAAGERGACRSDVNRLCSEVAKSRRRDGRAFACLLKHEKELTEACKENVERHRAAFERRQAAAGAQNNQRSSSTEPARPAHAARERGACRNDVKRVCRELVNPRPGDNRVITCLIKHEIELTEACKRNVERHRAALERRGTATEPSNPR